MRPQTFAAMHIMLAAPELDRLWLRKTADKAALSWVLSAAVAMGGCRPHYSTFAAALHFLICSRSASQCHAHAMDGDHTSICSHNDHLLPVLVSEVLASQAQQGLSHGLGLQDCLWHCRVCPSSSSQFDVAPALLMPVVMTGDEEMTCTSPQS